jgi:hypothetical protein
MFFPKASFPSFNIFNFYGAVALFEWSPGSDFPIKL